jgi:hypothetical protein
VGIDTGGTMSDASVGIIAADDDRTEWDRIWSSMEARRIDRMSEAYVRTMYKHDFGPPISAVVARVPDRYIEKMYFAVQNCPVCTAPAIDPATIYAVNLSIEFERVKGIGAAVWAHRDCFDSLPLSKEPTPVPW